MQAHKVSENREMSVRYEMGHLELAGYLQEGGSSGEASCLHGGCVEKVEGDIQVGRTLMEALSKCQTFLQHSLTLS